MSEDIRKEAFEMLEQIYTAHNMFYSHRKKITEDEINADFDEKFMSMQDFRNDIGQSSELLLSGITGPTIDSMLGQGSQKQHPHDFDIIFVEFGFCLFAAYYQYMAKKNEYIPSEIINFIKINNYANRLISFVKLLKFNEKKYISEKKRIEKIREVKLSSSSTNQIFFKKLVKNNINEIFQEGRNLEKVTDKILNIWEKEDKNNKPSRTSLIRWLKKVGINAKNINQLPEISKHF